MRTWMKIGVETIPEQAELIRLASNAMDMWIKLAQAWADCTDETKLKILRYSKWCVSQGGDVYNAATCAFIEHVVEEKSNWTVFKKVFSVSDIRGLNEVWKYRFGKESEDFLREITK